MNRRAFLRALLVAPVAAPVVAEAALKATAGLWAWWRRLRLKTFVWHSPYFSFPSSTIKAWRGAIFAEAQRETRFLSFSVVETLPRRNGGGTITFTRARKLTAPEEVRPYGSLEAHEEGDGEAHAEEGRQKEVGGSARRWRGDRA